MTAVEPTIPKTAAGGSGPAISVNRLSVTVGGGSAKSGGKFLLRDVSFDVPLGGSLAIIGETGSGKSTLVHCVMGIQHRSLRVTDGELALFGRQFTSAGGSFEVGDVRGGIVAMVFQDAMSSFDPNVRTSFQMAEIVRKHRRLSRQDALAVVQDSLRGVGLGGADVAAMWPFNMSGGMRQRAMIALARATGAPLLICDEPTTALDPIHTREICELLLEDLESGRTLILVTHDLRVAAAVCSQVAVLYRGTLIEMGPVDRVLAAPAHPYTARLLAAASGSHPSASGIGGNALALEDGRGVVGTAARSEPASRSACTFATECPWYTHACDVSETVPWRTEPRGHRVRCVRELGRTELERAWWQSG